MSAQTNQPLPAGYVLNGYRIEKPLSSGGFSIVYLARDENGTPYAIKEYLPSSLPLRSEGVEVQITDEALESSVELSTRYISGRFLPDKAIDVIDEAGSRVRMRTMTRPPDLKELEREIEELNKEKEAAVALQDFERAANLRDQADKLKKKKEQIKREWRELMATLGRS